MAEEEEESELQDTQTDTSENPWGINLLNAKYQVLNNSL